MKRLIATVLLALVLVQTTNALNWFQAAALAADSERSSNRFTEELCEKLDNRIDEIDRHLSNRIERNNEHLNKKLEEKNKEIKELKEKLEAQEKRLQQLEALLKPNDNKEKPQAEKSEAPKTETQGK